MRIAQIANPQLGANDNFGSRYFDFGPTFLLGVPVDDPNAVTDAGTIYRFNRSNATLTATISHPNPNATEFFGDHIVRVGDGFAVGVGRDDPFAVMDTGTVYLYDQTGGLIESIENPEPDPGDLFGNYYSIANCGDTFVVTSELDDVSGFDEAGSLHVFDSMTGVLIRSVENPAPALGDHFGRRLTAVGQSFFAGSEYDLGGAGAGYLFSSTGGLIAAIPNPSPNVNDEFTSRMAVVAGNLAIGEARETVNGSAQAGVVYLYDGATGALISTIENPLPNVNDNFGGSVHAIGSLLFVSVPGDEVDGIPSTGSIFVFDGETGEPLMRLINPVASATAGFGTQIIRVAGNLVVASPGANVGNVTNAGAVTLFDAITGDLIAHVLNPEPAVGDSFGRDTLVAVGSNFAVGMHQDSPAGLAQAGSVFVFNGVTGDLVASLQHPSPSAGDLFGIVYPLDANRFLVTAQHDDDGGFMNAGSAFVYAFDHAPDAQGRVIVGDEDTSLPIDVSTLDPDGDAVTYTISVSPVHGGLSGSGPTFTYVPAPDVHGPDLFEFTVTDSFGAAASAVVHININPVNDAPTALPEEYELEQAGTLVVNAQGVLTNDTDRDFDLLTAELAGDVTNGDLVLEADGAFEYTPAPGFIGTDSFTYRATDGIANSAVVEVSIEVTPADKIETSGCSCTLQERSRGVGSSVGGIASILCCIFSRRRRESRR